MTLTFFNIKSSLEQGKFMEFSPINFFKNTISILKIGVSLLIQGNFTIL